jgi:hypothetical protein
MPITWKYQRELIDAAPRDERGVRTLGWRRSNGSWRGGARRRGECGAGRDLKRMRPFLFTR